LLEPSEGCRLEAGSLEDSRWRNNLPDALTLGPLASFEELLLTLGDLASFEELMLTGKRPT